MPDTKVQLFLLETLETGDEIHFTDGTIWSCAQRRYGGVVSEVVLVPVSFDTLRNEDWVGVIFTPFEVKPLLFDAVRGGAKVRKGVGLADKTNSSLRCEYCGKQDSTVKDSSLRCEYCGKQDSTVKEILDPYTQDVHNEEIVLATLCDDCFEKDADLQSELRDRRGII